MINSEHRSNSKTKLQEALDKLTTHNSLHEPQNENDLRENKMVTKDQPQQRISNTSTSTYSINKFLIGFCETLNDVRIEYPCKEVKPGKLILLVGSGADTNLVKQSAMMDKDNRKDLSGPFGGQVTTLGTTF